MFYILLAVANAILSKVLKRAIKQPRPVGSSEGGYGFPSSHTQSLFYFFSIVASLALGTCQQLTLPRALLVAIVGTYAFLARYAYMYLPSKNCLHLSPFNQYTLTNDL